MQLSHTHPQTLPCRRRKRGVVIDCVCGAAEEDGSYEGEGALRVLWCCRGWPAFLPRLRLLLGGPAPLGEQPPAAHAPPHTPQKKHAFLGLLSTHIWQASGSSATSATCGSTWLAWACAASRQPSRAAPASARAPRRRSPRTAAPRSSSAPRPSCTSGGCAGRAGAAALLLKRGAGCRPPAPPRARPSLTAFPATSIDSQAGRDPAPHPARRAAAGDVRRPGAAGGRCVGPCWQAGWAGRRACG